MQEVLWTAAVSEKQTVLENDTNPKTFFWEILKLNKVNVKCTPHLNSLSELYFTTLDCSGAAPYNYNRRRSNDLGV